MWESSSRSVAGPSRLAFVTGLVMLLSLGCGASDRAELRGYFESFSRVGSDVDGLTEAQLELAERAEGASDAETIAAVRAYLLETTLLMEGLAQEYKALHVPAEVRSEHLRFVRAFDDFVSGLESAAGALEGAETRLEAAVLTMQEVDPTVLGLKESCASLQLLADDIGVDLRCASIGSSPGPLLL